MSERHSKIKALDLNKATETNRIYTRDEVIKAFETVTFPMNGYSSKNIQNGVFSETLFEPSHLIEQVHVIKDELFIDILILDNYEGAVLQKLLKEGENIKFKFICSGLYSSKPRTTSDGESLVATLQDIQPMTFYYDIKWYMD